MLSRAGVDTVVTVISEYGASLMEHVPAAEAKGKAGDRVMDGAMTGAKEDRAIARINNAETCRSQYVGATVPGRPQAENTPNNGRQGTDASTTAIKAGALSYSGMIELIDGGAVCAVDATHPFARDVKERAKKACHDRGIPYIRAARDIFEDKAREYEPNTVYVKSYGEAVRFLENTDGRILLTVGTNNLDKFAIMNKSRERLFIRVLSDSLSVRKCEDLGFNADNIIAMKGPFSVEMNVALLKDIGASYLVTKQSGAAGGYGEKARAAAICGVTMVVITLDDKARASESEGIRLAEAVGEAVKIYRGACGEKVKGNCRDAVTRSRNAKVGADETAGLHETVKTEVGGVGGATTSREVVDVTAGSADTFGRFPIFIDLKDEDVLIVGGGHVAVRRAEVLKGFGAKVKVIAPEISEKMPSGVECVYRQWQVGDCCRASMVIAATDDPDVNLRVAAEAASNGIPVSCASDRAAGTFYFPAIIKEAGITCGMISGDSKRTMEMAQKMRDWLKTQ
jgi:precorrin-2 dehydrogenase/sirohydrochlorin ferrochelatase/precorrin-6A/cobalt-precorrin-6A reductase